MASYTADGSGSKYGAGSTGRTKHTVTGTVVPLAKSTSSGIGKSVGEGTGTQAIKNATASNYNAQLTNTTRSSSGNSGDGGNNGGYSYSSSSDDIVSKIKALLEEQKKAADEYYKTMYEQQLAQINRETEANRNQANLNYMRGDRYLNSLYGNGITGQGLSNKARNNSNWQNNLTSIRQNQANNNATALSNYNMNLANTASQLAQGWYNYVLPVYTNRQQQLDNLDYRKYLATL